MGQKTLTQPKTPQTFQFTVEPTNKICSKCGNPNCPTTGMLP